MGIADKCSIYHVELYNVDNVNLCYNWQLLYSLELKGGDPLLLFHHKNARADMWIYTWVCICFLEEIQIFGLPPRV